VAAVVTVLLLLVAGSAAFLLRHRTRDTAHAAEQTEIQQAEDRRNTVQMEDNPMLAAKRAQPVTTVQNPTFQFQHGTGAPPVLDGTRSRQQSGSTAADYAVATPTTVQMISNVLYQSAEQTVAPPEYAEPDLPSVLRTTAAAAGLYEDPTPLMDADANAAPAPGSGAGAGAGASVYYDAETPPSEGPEYAQLMDDADPAGAAHAGAGADSVYAVPVEEAADPTYSGYEAPSAGDAANQQHARAAQRSTGNVMVAGPTRATPAAGGHRQPQRCARPSPNGGTCKTMAVSGGQFCSRHSCPKCGASKSSAAGGCAAHGGLNTEA
jgi:hypothetical protein